MTLISERMICSSFYLTAFPIGPLWECLPIPLEAGGLVRGRTYTHIMKSWLAASFGGVADREKKHSGEEASGIRGARVEDRPGFPRPASFWA